MPIVLNCLSQKELSDTKRKLNLLQVSKTENDFVSIEIGEWFQ